ncbi:MAG TPA: DUF533 domain-containing protein [Vicinamibacterales bacterium]|nr:DUF533 domain-containing protein [Vicinamibacterales bacterium]
MLNNPADVLSIVLSGTLGRSGRKRARRATRFLTGHKGFLSTSALIGMAGVAWGIYDTLKAQNNPTVPGVQAVPPLPNVPPLPATVDPVVQVIQLAISAAKADGTLTEQERALILERARQAGLESLVEAELGQTRSLADIVRGITDDQMKKDLYVLAFTIVRADEAVSGAERIYLAQLAHRLGLDVAAVSSLEAETSKNIDSQPEA